MIRICPSEQSHFRSQQQRGIGAHAQEYLAQWVAKVTSAEKDYRGAVHQMERPAAPHAAPAQSGAARSSGAPLTMLPPSITSWRIAGCPGTLTAFSSTESHAL